MIRVELGHTGNYCDGLSRRSFVQLGVAGLASAGLPQILRAKEQSAARGTSAKNTSCILIWLDGGPSHMDLYDLKPEAPAQYRGIWNPIPTNVPGIDIGELFPLQARCADKFSLIRSLYHNNGDHFAAGHILLTGRTGASGADTPGRSPFVGSIITKQTGPRRPGMPAHVAVPYAMSIGLRPGYFGANYLGVAHNPFETEGDPNNANFQVQNVNLPGGLSIARLEDRAALAKHFDKLRRDVDASGMVDAMDRFGRQAYDLVAGEEARRAFNISLEDPRQRDRYGRHSWPQSMLLARRLVEAGATFVTVHLGGWDHHWDLKAGMERNLPIVDRGVSALLEDLAQRGLWDSTVVMLMGEFSRTPRMNDGGNGGAPGSMGTPGRDHWGNAMFCLMGGGGIQGGRIVGSTNRLGEAPQDRPVTAADLHHTLFHAMGVDPEVSFLNHAGRPVPALEPGSVIHELL
jgi:hypothetical protein